MDTAAASLRADENQAQDHESAQQAHAQIPCMDITCLTIAECTPVADQIRQHLLSSPRLQLNLANCEEIDTAGVQLLTILRCDEGVASRIMFDSPSETAMHAFNLLGLASLFTSDAQAV